MRPKRDRRCNGDVIFTAGARMTPINLVTSLHRIAKHTTDFVSRRAVRRDVRFRALWDLLASKIPHLQPQ
eukprot:685999-Prorocentrum_minimum.AAC.5